MKINKAVYEPNSLYAYLTILDGYKETLKYNIKHIKGDTPYKRRAKELLKELE